MQRRNLGLSVLETIFRSELITLEYSAHRMSQERKEGNISVREDQLHVTASGYAKR